ncbi:DNA/RNA nuclease SfsA [Glycocaulis profundi]|nr:DNA/RNA nuclease SfsA [Glycocaulis profundi]
MDFPRPLIPAVLERRYMRFLADVTLESGERITVHCPNPGSMMGLKDPGSRCWLSQSDNPKRKLKHTLEVLEADGALVGINTGLPNRLAEEAITAGGIAPLTGYASMRREVKYGTNSRIDLLLEDAARPPCWVEVKNVHLMREPGLAEFPDSVTSRGAKHLLELAARAQAGERAVQLFIVQRPDCQRFTPAADIDPVYAEGLRAARDAGVEILGYGCDVSLSAISVARPVEIAL